MLVPDTIGCLILDDELRWSPGLDRGRWLRRPMRLPRKRKQSARWRRLQSVM